MRPNLAAVLIAATLPALAATSACSSGPSYTFQGQPVVDTDQALTGIEAQWRTSLSADTRKANAPDTSHCFWQVGVGNVINPAAICGPIHFLGDDKSTWQTTKLVSIPAEGDTSKGTLASERGRFNDSEPLPNSALVGLGGAPGNAAATAAAPPLPVATPGEVIPNAQTTAQPVASDVEIISSDTTRDWTIAVDQPVTATTGADAKKAPSGGRFVTFQIRPLEHSISDGQSHPVEWTVKSGGASFPVATDEQGATPDVVTMAVPGQDAVLSMTHTGVTQTVDLVTGKRGSGTPADAYYLTYQSGRNQFQAALDSSRPVGTVNGTGEISVRREGYSSVLGRWAAPGKMFVSVTADNVQYYVVGTTPLAGGGTSHSMFSTNFVDENVSIANVAITGADKPIKIVRTNTDSWDWSSWRAIYEVPISDGPSTKVTITYKGVATAIGYFIGAPTTPITKPISLNIDFTEHGTNTQ